MTGQPFTLLVDIPLELGRADEFMALLNDVFEAMKVEEIHFSFRLAKELLCENEAGRTHVETSTASRACTDLNSLCYNSVTRQGQLLWVGVCLRYIFVRDLACCP